MLQGNKSISLKVSATEPINTFILVFCYTYLSVKHNIAMNVIFLKSDIPSRKQLGRKKINQLNVNLGSFGVKMRRCEQRLSKLSLKWEKKKKKLKTVFR